MKIFDKDGKINFVDENNVFLGYDMQQDCCEDADWFVSVNPDEKVYSDCYENNHDNDIEKANTLLDGYSFDVNYFHEVNDDMDDGGHVCFKATREHSAVLYIHIFNSQNGYYSHGFEFGIDKKVTREDCI